MDNIFSICMTAEGGVITFGAIPDNVAPVSIQYTPIIDEYFYTIYVTDVLVKGKSLGIHQSYYNYNTRNADGAAVDTGSSDLLFPGTVYEALEERVSSFCETEFLVGTCSEAPGEDLFSGYCFELTRQEILKYPLISVVLNGGVVLDISPLDWIVQGYCEDPSLYAIAIDSIPIGYGTILGDTALRGRTTVFDREVNNILCFFL